MQITETSADGLKREFKIVIPADEIDQKVQARLQELCRTAKIPGFRPGKVPMTVIRQRYGAAVLHEVRDRAINESARATVGERGLRAAFEPDIKVTGVGDGADLEYEMAIEVLPDIEPGDFSTIELERLTAPVQDSDVTTALGRLAVALAPEQAPAEPRPARVGDLVVIDFAGTVDGEAREGMKAEGHRLELGSGSLIPGFEDQLVGAGVGDHRTVTVTFPADYGAAELAGREAVFEVDVKELLEKQALPVSDELAQKAGLADLAALSAMVRERLAKDHAEMSRSRLKRQLLDQLAERHQFLVPPGMIDVEFESIWNHLQETLKSGGADAEDAGRDETSLRAEYRKIAERRVRLGLLLAEVGKRNNIKLSPEELQKAVLAEVRRHPGQEREIFDLIQKNPQLMERIRAPVFEDKVVDFILELTKITDRTVAVAELVRDPETPAA